MNTPTATSTSSVLSEEAFNAPTAPLTQVFVSNISPSANEQSLASFFSFCGSITSLKLTTFAGTNKASEAIVTFDSEAAAKTALLLTNAVIADRPITVVPFGEGVRQVPSTGSVDSGNVTEISGSQIPNKGYAVPDEQRTKISALAGLLAQGYQLGDDAIAKARSIDDQNHISERVSQAAAATRVKLAEIDQSYRISETFSNLAAGVAGKAQEVDQNWKISEGLQHVMRNVSDTVEVIGAKAKENPVVQGTMTKLTEVAGNVQSFVAPTVDAISANTTSLREQSNQIYLDGKRERGEIVPESGSGAVSTPREDGIELIPAAHNVDKILVAEENDELESPAVEDKKKEEDLTEIKQ
eukprot:TRINITY_DN12396_c1_g1_i1.p1 TRINITY_DN12396_c1_g1~~TRINITY_DN12396_c1_g1_i1.p1  ORF type:complete len:355 (+),score=151.26 TRINITY_DN12396_c1_g1_i1:37-1101(+)